MHDVHQSFGCIEIFMRIEKEVFALAAEIDTISNNSANRGTDMRACANWAIFFWKFETMDRFSCSLLHLSSIQKREKTFFIITKEDFIFMTHFIWQMDCLRSLQFRRLWRFKLNPRFFFESDKHSRKKQMKQSRISCWFFLKTTFGRRILFSIN